MSTTNSFGKSSFRTSAKERSLVNRNRTRRVLQCIGLSSVAARIVLSGAANSCRFLLAPPSPMLPNLLKMGTMWRRRVEVESTIRPAKDRIAGFEGRGSHRTPFASGGSIAGEEKRFRGRERTRRKMIGRERTARIREVELFRRVHRNGIGAQAEARATG